MGVEHKDDFSSTDYFKRCFLQDLGIYFVMWLSGLTVLGLGAAPCFCIFRGFTVGFSSAFILANYGVKGFFYDLLIIIPPNLIKIPTFLFASACMISYAVKTFSNSKSPGYKRNSVGQIFMVYTMMMSFAFIISLLGVLIQTYLVPYIHLILSSEMTK
jgi:stage II sporulation protein M